jgi:hypothetical protein
MENGNQNFIKALNDCSAECNQCYNADLNEEDIKMMAHCIRMCRNCSEICVLTASWIASGAEMAQELKALCKKMCEACADECEKHQHEHCKRCAEACRKCAESSR